MAFDAGMFGGGVGQILGGLFGNSGAPYEDAMKQYKKYEEQAQQVQNPYLNAGKGALSEYQKWLKEQKNPSGFVNNQISKYQASPYNSYLQQEAQNAGINAASASGLTGSTPFLQQQQQNSANIGQQGLEQWLQHVFGINTQYGQGQHNLVQGGQQSANALTDMYGNTGRQMAEAAYGKQASKKNDFWGTVGGGLGALAAFL